MARNTHQLVVGVCEGESLIGVNDHGERAVSKDLLEEDRVASALQVVGCKRVSRQMRLDALLNAGNLAQSAGSPARRLIESQDRAAVAGPRRSVRNRTHLQNL